MKFILKATGIIFCLVLCLPVIAAETQSSDAKLAQRVTELLQVGFTRTATSLQESQRLYESLRTESHNSPKIDYAHGLILLKQLRNKDAKADFLVATKRAGTPYPPAWQALIWSNLVAREFDDGYDRLLEYSKVLQESDNLTEDVRQNGAYWIGRVMSALELGLDSVQSREAWMQTEAKLLARMSADLTIAYNDGKEEVHAKHLVLESEIKLAREKEKEKQGKKIEEIDKSLDAADTKREKLKKSAEELKEEFEEQSTAYKKQMERMEKDYAIMERRGMTLLTQMLTFDQQINMMQNNRNVNQSFASLAALQSRRALLDTEFQMTASATQQLASTAQRMTQDRADVVAQYEKATGDITKEEAGVKKWKERTEKHAEELKKVAKKPVGPAGALNSKIQAATTFRTYVDLDLALERENVLKSFRAADGGK